MNHEFTKSSAATRSVLAAAAVVITISIGGFIDHLAIDYAMASHTTVQASASQAAAAAKRS